MKNIEKYGLERPDLVVATAVNAYLKNMTPEARKETLGKIVDPNGSVDGEKLAALIESAKAAAIISAEKWKDGDDPIYQKTLGFIREQLPAVDGLEYIKNPPKQFLQFIVDLARE